MSAQAPREPRPLPGAAGRLLAGNPFQDERVAFRWLIVILLGAATVVILARAVSATAAIIWGIVLLLVLAYGLVRVLAWLVGSPDEDDGPGSGQDRDQ